VSVRSGGSVSMPGKMSTVLNLGLTAEATAGLAAETGDPRFALDPRRRFLSSFAAAVTGEPVPDDPARQLQRAVAADRYLRRLPDWADEAPGREG
jgi:pyruvate, orthophosphate dikinase